MRSWIVVLAIATVMLVGDVAMAGHRRCGGRRHHRNRCGGGGCAVTTTCAGGSCHAGGGYVGVGGYAYSAPVAPDWTYGYPGVGYTGYGYSAFAGYQPGAFYGTSR
jgi:hypothetical protein